MLLLYLWYLLLLQKLRDKLVLYLLLRHMKMRLLYLWYLLLLYLWYLRLLYLWYLLLLKELWQLLLYMCDMLLLPKPWQLLLQGLLIRIKVRQLLLHLLVLLLQPLALGLLGCFRRWLLFQRLHCLESAVGASCETKGHCIWQVFDNACDCSLVAFLCP
jgi:hypothetical protein